MELIGWIINISFQKDETHIWIKDEHKTLHHLAVNYHPIMYVDAEGMNRNEVEELTQKAEKHPHVVKTRNMFAFASSEAMRVTPVIEVKVKSPRLFPTVVNDFRQLKRPLLNMDLHPREKFFLDTKSSPLAKCRIKVAPNGEFQIHMLETIRNALYSVVPLKVMAIDVAVKKGDNPFPSETDPIDSIEITVFSSHELLNTDFMANAMPASYSLSPKNLLDVLAMVEGDDIQSFCIELDSNQQLEYRSDQIWGYITLKPLSLTAKVSRAYWESDAFLFEDAFNEPQALILLAGLVQYYDPDVLIVTNGDRFTLPYLANRAKYWGIENDFQLGRLPCKLPLHNGSQSYVSYGQIHHKSMPIYIPGRIHIDRKNSHFFEDSGLFGVIELSRLGGVPPDRCARSTIGTVLTSIEFMIASTSNPPILIPQGKAKGELFKSSELLLVADNGGITYPALPGMYGKVWGIDFASLYPSIMLKHNISSETVLCKCCSDTGEKVPEIGYHICAKKRGIVPQTMKLILEKRLFYKYLQRFCTDPMLKKKYYGIDDSLKWILVSCFGYLGFKNARFGSIESHQAVTAYARHYLRIAQQVCQEHGFQTIAGLTDSLFIQARDDRYNTLENVTKTIKAISERTGIAINVDGYFKWIVFTNIKGHSGIAALNRYFGAYDDGRYKIRGILGRQHSTPPAVKEFQKEILEAMANLPDPEGVIQAVPELFTILEKWKRDLKHRKIDPKNLAFSIRSGKENYVSNTVQALTAKRYQKFGKHVKAGEKMRYIIVDNDRTDIDRVRLVDEKPSEYDVQWYLGYFEKAFLELVDPFMPKEVLDGKLRKQESILRWIQLEASASKKNLNHETAREHNGI